VLLWVGETAYNSNRNITHVIYNYRKTIQAYRKNNVKSLNLTPVGFIFKWLPLEGASTALEYIL